MSRTRPHGAGHFVVGASGARSTGWKTGGATKGYPRCCAANLTRNANPLTWHIFPRDSLGLGPRNALATADGVPLGRLSRHPAEVQKVRKVDPGFDQRTYITSDELARMGMVLHL